MNHPHPTQSFPDWQPPSPRSTPQSAKFSGYQFLSPPSSEPSPGYQHGWATPQGYVYTSAFPTPGVYVSSTSDGTSMTSSLKRPRPISYQNQPEGVTPQQAQPSMSFPSHSFLEQFHDTHIDNQQNDLANIAPYAVVPTQVQTPPPTRKTASSRRKQAPPLVIPVETPSTILSRRSSDHETWLKRSGNSSVSDMSPFQFPPLQISPPDPMQFPSGPLTAPVYPHSQLFWDPNTNPGLDQVKFPISTENPFMGNDQLTEATFPIQKQLASTPTSAVSQGGFVIPPLPAHIPPRPHSARPAAESGQSAMPPPPRSHLRNPSSVDPSMLVSAQLADPNALSRPSSVVNNAVPEGQPYQSQLEALRREKESRLRKLTRRQTTVDSATMSYDVADLRRNATDNRARKTVSVPQTNQTVSFEQKDIPTNLGSGPISRNASPLKRQKSSLQQTPTVSPLKPVGRKSVVLTVDAKGIARAEVKTVDKVALHKQNSATSFNASSSESDSDSSDLPEGPPHTRSSSSLGFIRPTTKTSPPNNDAQEALREVVKANSQRKQSTVGSQIDDGTVFGYGPTILPTNTYVPANHYITTAWNISPTTVTEVDLESPADRDVSFLTSTRCVCNNSINDAGRHMVQW